VVEIFGEKVLKSSGELDRSALGQIIFSNPEAREQLEKILHPRIQELRAAERRELERRNIETAFYDVPLLFEKNLQSEFDATVLVYAKPETQRRRLKERDHLSEDEIQKRLGAQWPIDEKVKLANYVIINEDGLAELRANVLTVLSDLKIQTGL
jgi:dephospho-CoA kinase